MCHLWKTEGKDFIVAVVVKEIYKKKKKFWQHNSFSVRFTSGNFLVFKSIPENIKSVLNTQRPPGKRIFSCRLGDVVDKMTLQKFLDSLFIRIDFLSQYFAKTICFIVYAVQYPVMCRLMSWQMEIIRQNILADSWQILCFTLTTSILRIACSVFLQLQ